MARGTLRSAMADLIPLAQAHCVPRRGHEHRLTDASIRELLPQLPAWELAEDGHALVRTFTFKDYYRTMSFVNAAVTRRPSRLRRSANCREPRSPCSSPA